MDVESLEIESFSDSSDKIGQGGPAVTRAVPGDASKQDRSDATAPASRHDAPTLKAHYASHHSGSKQQDVSKPESSKYDGGSSKSNESTSSKRDGTSSRPTGSRDTKDTQSTTLQFKQGTGRLLTRVKFQVSCVTLTGDQLWVVGSIPSLGCWKVQSGVRLLTDAKQYPVWTGSIEVPSGVPVEYKYVLRKASGQKMQWEDNIGNRMFTPEGVFVLLEDGRFNVERARLLDREQKKLFVDKEGRTSKFNEYSDLEVSLSPSDTVYIMSYLLPLKCEKNQSTGQYSFSWHPGYGCNTSSRHAMYVIEKLHRLNKKAQIWHIGWLGVEIPPEEREKVAEILKWEFQCLPVWLSSQQARENQEFTDEILRPLFHFCAPTESDMCTTYCRGVLIPENPSDDQTPAGPRSPRKDQCTSKWQAYNIVNLQFVQPLVERFNDGDYVLVFDIDLMMVPSIVGSRCRSANIGYVFNTPFPSSDIFRMLPSRKELLRSLLNSDMIHFQCFTYARHFLTCCSRLLGLEYHSMRGGLVQVNFNGHRVHIRASHVGMDTAQFFEQYNSDPEVREHKTLWKDKIAGRHVVLGYDDLEPMSGITLKLTSMQSLARLFPSILGNVVMILVAVPLKGPDGKLVHQGYAQKVQQMVDQVNLSHPGMVLYYQRRMPFAERTALFASSDVLVNSSIRHGLNLVPFEFVLCGSEKKGGFVVSEFLGCSRVLPGAVRTNPWRDEDMAKAIHRLLLVEEHQKDYWHQLQVAFCRHNTVASWAENMLTDMQRIRQTMLGLGEDVSRAGCRVGIAKMTHKEMSKNYLKVEQVYKAYSNSETRLIVVDIDLLLRPILHPEKALEGSSVLVSRNEIVKCLQNIAAHPGNILFLLSSSTPQELRSWFGNMKGLDKIGLAGEDGYCYKWPGSPAGRWDIKMEVETGWKDVALSLMEQYTQRTNGSYIDDEKTASLTWHWERCNPDFGNLQGRELQNHLKEMLSHFPVRIIKGRTYVRVRHEGVTKGALVEHIIKHYNTRGGVDFVLCLGDDVADTDMFEVINVYHRDAQYRVVSNSQTLREVKVFPCTVGRQPSVASYCLYSAEEVFELMSGLFLQIKRAGRVSSMVELSSVFSRPCSVPK